MTRQAIIIGAGPAGCVAAILLSRGGWQVHLVEQHRFPHDKVCGECLSALGFEVLGRIGLAERFIQELSPIRITQSRIRSSAGKQLCMNLPQPMWGISRRRLDEWLFSSAISEGVIAHQPVRCEELVAGSRPKIETRNLSSNATQQMEADIVLLADGKGALLPTRARMTNDLGIKTHFTSVTGSRDAIDLFGVDGHYGGVAPIENDLWNIAFSVPQDKVRAHNGNLDALFADILQENRSMADRFTDAKRSGPWLASPLPRSSVADRWPTNVIPLGNAAAAIEPIGGEGMGLAMRSAELAVELLIQDRFDPSTLRTQFRQLWRIRSLACRGFAKAISNRRVANLALPMLRPIPSRLLMAAIGK
jgi:flavin-dependent dehydrogenase